VHTFDGFQVYRAHEDCDQAASELHANGNLMSDEYVTLSEDADRPADEQWIREKYPAVAKRLWA